MLCSNTDKPNFIGGMEFSLRRVSLPTLQKKKQCVSKTVIIVIVWNYVETIIYSILFPVFLQLGLFLR